MRLAIVCLKLLSYRDSRSRCNPLVAVNVAHEYINRDSSYKLRLINLGIRYITAMIFITIFFWPGDGYPSHDWVLVAMTAKLQ